VAHPPDAVNVSGLWCFQSSMNQSQSHVVFHHPSGSQSFSGYVKGWADIYDGIVQGNKIQWKVDTFECSGSIDEGMHRIAIDTYSEGKHLESLEGTREGDQQVLQAVVYVDRGLDLKSLVNIKEGATILVLKEQIAREDPTGGIRAQEIGLIQPGFGELGNAVVVRADFSEVDICMQ